MPLPPYEVSIWIPGVPLSAQSKEKFSDGYMRRVRDAAAAVFPTPLSSDRIELVLVYVASARRPDVDNAVKRIVDALKGVVYFDDKQVASHRSAVLPKDGTPRQVGGAPHHTFARLLDGNGSEFLLRVRVPPVLSIFSDLESS